VGGFFLITEHTAHVFGVLPWLLVGACPLCMCSCIMAITATMIIRAKVRALRDRRKSHDP
jgi:hypothetical protein